MWHLLLAPLAVVGVSFLGAAVTVAIRGRNRRR